MPASRKRKKNRQLSERTSDTRPVKSYRNFTPSTPSNADDVELTRSQKFEMGFWLALWGIWLLNLPVFVALAGMSVWAHFHGGSSDMLHMWLGISFAILIAPITRFAV
jgi:hypothetical protein